MNNKEIKEIYLNKINLYQKYNKHYHDKSKPIVSDYEFDNLKNDIFELEKKYKYLNNKNSPTNTVGYKPSKNFIKSLKDFKKNKKKWKISFSTHFGSE